MMGSLAVFDEAPEHGLKATGRALTLRQGEAPSFLSHARPAAGRTLPARQAAHPVDVPQRGTDGVAQSPSRGRSVLFQSRTIPPYRNSRSRSLLRCRPMRWLLSENVIR